MVRKGGSKNGMASWVVDTRIKGVGKRYQCATQEEATTLAEQLRIKRVNAEAAACLMPDHERIDAQAALDLLRPHGKTLLEASRHYLKSIEIVQANIPLVQLADELQRARAADGYAKVSLSGMRKFHVKFAGDHPSMTVQDFSPDIIDRWLQARPIAASSRNLERALLHALFNFGVKRQYLTTNPVTEVAKAHVTEKQPGLLNVEQCTRLLLAAREDFLPALALGMFAGLCPLSELLPLDWAHIDLQNGRIDIAAERTRTAKKRNVTIQPNLAEWLLPFKKETGQVFASPKRSSATYGAHLTRTRLVAGLTAWPPDALRHTFGGMHFAHFKSAGLTAQEMGHTAISQIEKHYRERVTPSEAAAFWNIRPGQQSSQKGIVVPMIATA